MRSNSDVRIEVRLFWKSTRGVDAAHFLVLLDSRPLTAGRGVAVSNVGAFRPDE